MTWTGVEMWDGTAHKAEITQALMQYIDSAEKRQALITSYGDLAVLMKKKYRNSGASCGEWDLWGMNQGVVMKNTKKRYKCRITWNKAAKLIQMECKRVAGKNLLKRYYHYPYAGCNGERHEQKKGGIDVKDITMEDVIEYFKEKGTSESKGPLYLISLTDGTRLETIGGGDVEDCIVMLLFHMDTIHNIMKNIDKYSTDSVEEWTASMGKLYLDYRKKYGKIMDDMRNNSQKLEIIKVPGWMK